MSGVNLSTSVRLPPEAPQPKPSNLAKSATSRIATTPPSVQAVTITKKMSSKFLENVHRVSSVETTPKGSSIQEASSKVQEESVHTEETTINHNLPDMERSISKSSLLQETELQKSKDTAKQEQSFNEIVDTEHKYNETLSCLNKCFDVVGQNDIDQLIKNYNKRQPKNLHITKEQFQKLKDNFSRTYEASTLLTQKLDTAREKSDLTPLAKVQEARGELEVSTNAAAHYAAETTEFYVPMAKFLTTLVEKKVITQENTGIQDGIPTPENPKPSRPWTTNIRDIGTSLMAPTQRSMRYAMLVEAQAKCTPASQGKETLTALEDSLKQMSIRGNRSSKAKSMEDASKKEGAPKNTTSSIINTWFNKNISGKLPQSIFKA